jgi:hypothetical protein
MDITLNQKIFSDPDMRSHLEKYYDYKYASFRDEIEKKADQEPLEMPMVNGDMAQGFTADQYLNAIPSFDKWLEIQQNHSLFDLSDVSLKTLEMNKASLDHQLANHPDTASGVNTVFSNGDQIAGYLTKNGLVTHSRGSFLAQIDRDAQRLGLLGADYIAYMREHGGEKLADRYENAKITAYDQERAPTKREFMQSWYPEHSTTIDKDYQDRLRELRSSIDHAEKWHANAQNNLYEMQRFLLQSIKTT